MIKNSRQSDRIGPVRTLAAGLILMLASACAAPAASPTPTAAPTATAPPASPAASPTAEALTPTAAAQWEDFSASGIYSFRYPLDRYSVRNGPDHTGALEPGVIAVEPNDAFNSQAPLAQTYRITVAVHDNIEGLTMADAARLLSQGGILVQYDPGLLGDAHPIQDYAIGGMPAYRVDDLPVGASGSVTQIVTLHNNRIYEWVIETAQADGDARNRPLVEDILETFQLAS